MIRRLSILLLLAGGLHLMSFVAPDFKTRYLQKAAETQSIQCAYTQEKHISQLKEPVISKGSFSYLHPGKIRLDQQEPTSNLIILTPDSIFTKESGKVSRLGMEDHPYFKYLNQLILGTVNGEIFEEKYFDTSVKEGVAVIQVELIPKSRMMKRRFANISLVFDANDLSLKSMEMIEKSGDSMKMIFHDPQVNLPIKKAIFKL